MKTRIYSNVSSQIKGINNNKNITSNHYNQLANLWQKNIKQSF